nr:hypothetical protein [Candidatus Sigynarchaeota archaeon]
TRPQPNASYSVMKNLAMITGGDFAYFSNTSAYSNAVANLSSKKDLNDINGYWQAQETARAAPLLSEIAVELRRPTVDEIQVLIADPNKSKCNICYRSTSPTGQAPFVSLRYCPSCGRAMHLQCAHQWAKNAPDATEEVFRCPFCYFLIRDSTSSILSKFAKANAQVQSQSNQATTFIQIPRDKVPDIDGSCANCRIIFMGEFDVYKCRSCGSYYHAPCVKEIQEKYKACRICGRPIQNIDQILQ